MPPRQLRLHTLRLSALPFFRSLLGPWARSSAGAMCVARRAPRLGEHNEEVYGSLGLTAADLDGLRGRGVI